MNTLDREQVIYEIVEYYRAHGQWPTKIAYQGEYHRGNSSLHRLGGFGVLVDDARSVFSDSDFDVPEIPDGEITTEELLDRRKREFAAVDAHEKMTSLVPVKINIDGPIAICHLGDPHLDDRGTDIARIERDLAVIRKTDGMYAANVGDVTNNWVGRLQRLYAEQTTTAAEAWKLAEWFFDSAQWLYAVKGNHDVWSGAGDPLNWILRGRVGVHLTRPGGVRIALRFRNGREVRVNARHDFRGHSQWNPVHAITKAAKMGWRDHILVAGHTHENGYGFAVCPKTKLVSHCFRIASYKIYDRFAHEKGFDNTAISPYVVTIIDPDANNETAMITHYWDLEFAADILQFLRRRAA